MEPSGLGVFFVAMFLLINMIYLIDLFNMIYLIDTEL